MKKSSIRAICWLAGAIIWAIVAWSYFSEGKTGFAMVQAVLAVCFAANAVRSFLKNQKK